MTDQTSCAVWTQCPECEEHWCNVHHCHVHECSCPPVEVWVERFNMMPYDMTRNAEVVGWLLTPEGTFGHDDE